MTIKKEGQKKMKCKKLILSTLFFLLGLGLTGLQAQETVPAAGGNASDSGGTVSYSVGQVVYTTHSGNNGSVGQGVQQAYEISVVTGIDETAINLSVSAYPNPTTNFITLKIDNADLSALSFYLYDLSGRLIQSQEIEGNETRIEMSHLIVATYFVKVTENNRELKTFKILKH